MHRSQFTLFAISGPLPVSTSLGTVSHSSAQISLRVPFPSGTPAHTGGQVVPLPLGGGVN